MLTSIKKILLSPVAGIRWVNALECAAKGDFASAQQLLVRLREFYEGTNAEFHLLRAYVYLRLGKLAESVADCESATLLLRSSSRYKDEEKRYLSCYSSKVANLAIAEMPTGNRPEKFDETTCSRLDIVQVREALRLSFPIGNNNDIIR